MTYIEKHQRGLEQFQNGDYAEAVRWMDEALAECESSELWNDWATVQTACGKIDQAKRGYRRALELNAADSQSAANLGVLLLSEGDPKQALPLLEQSLAGLDERQQVVVQALIQQYRRPEVPIVKRQKK